MLTGCETVSFYHQAIVGQGKLLWQRESIESLIENPNTDLALKLRLILVRDVLEFSDESGLPPGGAYSTYVETGRPFVVWNVFAAMPLDLKLKVSCFPIAGCVTYRGFFDREKAIGHAERLKDEGYETHVAGVAAYSTLGWFEDPLLDTFLFREEARTAALIFHELAHRHVYVKDDTRFNESVATTIEQYLLRQWLIARGEPERFASWEASSQRRAAVIKLIDETREKLRVVYASQLPDHQRLAQKTRLINELKNRYDSLAASWSTGEEFRFWMAGPINNAKLETIADYNAWVPVLSARLDEIGFGPFLAELPAYADLAPGVREELLKTASFEALASP